MNSYSVSAIANNTYFTSNVFLDETFQLLDPSVPLTESMKKALIEWDFKVVYSDGSQKTEKNMPVQPQTATSTPQEEKKPVPQNVSYESIDINDLLGLPQQSSSLGEVPPPPPVPDVPFVDDIPETPAAAAPVTAAKEEHNTVSKQDAANSEKIRETYDEYLEYVNDVYTRYATHKELNFQEIADKSKQLVLFVRDNQNSLLRIIPSEKERKKNFLVSHSMRSTVLAITIGTALHLQPHKLVNLAVACILHEIGQIRLPPQLYMTDRLLTAPEKTQMTKHPIIGYNILKEHNFPLEVQLGVLDHHERENGSGYPRKIAGDKITSFAKIISVACSFEAISAPRLFREERSTYEAMVEMMQNHDKAYDETVIKALLKCLSLFPIGAYVQLADGNIAQVVDVIANEPKHPKVQIIEKGTNALADIVETNTAEHRIVRVLNKKEIAKIKKAN
ncbi:MAG: HD domain-containing protein [Treponema sp.]|nr:HD domain-containing protein [Treponema sp.]